MYGTVIVVLRTRTWKVRPDRIDLYNGRCSEEEAEHVLQHGDLVLRMLAQLFAQAFHFSEGVLVAGAVRGSNTFVEAGERFGDAVEFGESLGGHLVGRNVVGVEGDEAVELFQTLVRAALADVFHGEAVAGERVVRVELEDFVEGGDLVHPSIVVAEEVKA